MVAKKTTKEKIVKAVKKVASTVKKATTKKTKTDSTPKPETKNTNLKCVWCLGTPCSSDVKETGMFWDDTKNDYQIYIPICSNHLEEHRIIMALYANKFDIEEVLQQTPEWRKEQYLTLKLSGLIADENAIKL